MKTCMFTGHHFKNQSFLLNEKNESCNQLKKHLDFLIREEIRNGTTRFLTSMDSRVTCYAAEIVLSLREKYPNIILDAVIPCSNQTRNLSNKLTTQYNNILKQCNNLIVLQDASNNLKQKLNVYLVEHSDCVIAIWNGTNKSISKIVRNALKKKLSVTVLHPSTFSIQIL